MRRLFTDKTSAQQTSRSAFAATGTTCLRLWFVTLLYCISLHLLPNSWPIRNCSYRDHSLPNILSPGSRHRQTRVSYMRMAQSSARVATTTTLALFRRFNTISSFQLFPLPSVVTKSKAFSNTAPTPSLSPYNSIDKSPLLRCYLSSNSRETKDDHRRASFSVPAMGTGDDSDGSTIANNYTGYEKWVRRLYATNMFHPVKLGLENMHLLHELLGKPMDDVSVREGSLLRYSAIVFFRDPKN